MIGLTLLRQAINDQTGVATKTRWHISSFLVFSFRRWRIVFLAIDEPPGLQTPLIMARTDTVPSSEFSLAFNVNTFGWLKGMTIATLYLISAEMGHWLSFPQHFATFWPPAGVCIVALTIHHRRLWWRIVLATVLANLVFDLGLHQRSLGVGLGFSLAHAIEAVSAATILRLWMKQQKIRLLGHWTLGGDFDGNISRAILGDWRSVLVFAAGGCLVATALGASVGSMVAIKAFGGSGSKAFLMWWSGDAIGMLVVGALGFGIMANWPFRQDTIRPNGSVIATLILVWGLSVFVFGVQQWPIVYLVMPLVVLLVFRANHLASAVGLFVLAVVAAFCTSRGLGPFAVDDDVLIRATLLQVYLGVMGLSILAFEAIIREKHDREEQVRFELRTIVDSLDALVFMKDANHRILRCNEAAARALCMTPEQVAGRHASELFPNEYSTFEKSEREILRTGVTQRNFLERLALPNGAVISVESSKVAYRDRFGNIEGLIVVLNDVTKQMQAEKELAGLGRLIEESTNEVFIFHAKSLKFIRVNQGALKNLGYTLDEMQAMTPVDIKPLHDHESFLALVQPIIDGEETTLSFETLHQRKDGSCYPTEIRLQRMDDMGTEVFVAFVSDVSERERAAEMIEVLFKRSPIPLLLFDRRGVIECNDAAVALLRVKDKSELIHKQPYDFSPEYQPCGGRSEDVAIPLVEAAFREGFLRFEWMHQRPDGTTFLTEVFMRSIKLETGDAFLCNWNDITESRKLENEIVSANRRLESSNSELAQFAYIASHDLKAPLRAISSLAGFVQDDCRELLPTESMGHLKMMQGRIVRMGKLLDDLLAYSRVGRSHGAMTETDTRVILDRAVDFSAIDEEIIVAVEGDRIRLTTLETPLQTCLRNLISNAVKHRKTSGGVIHLSAADEGDHVVFEVADDGDGIPSQHQDRVFRMFETLRARDDVEGSGMGLAFVKKTIETYGGSISVESPNTLGGTTFRLRWPKEISV